MTCPHNNQDYFEPTGETFCLTCGDILSASTELKHVIERKIQDRFVGVGNEGEDDE